MRRPIAWIISVLLLVAPPAFAWGGAGHRLIATLAQDRLTPAARAELDRLLAQEPGSTLASISTWADEVRVPGTGPWHYVNVSRHAACRFDAARDCENGRCLVSAIDQQIRRLRTSTDDAERLLALKYVVHLVSDAHQPLHAGFADDRGGNLYQVQAWGRGSNLHAVWDVALIEYYPGGPDGLRQAVQKELGSMATGTPTQWVEESCRVMSADDFYPAGHLLGSEYAARWSPMLVQRLAAAVQRLVGVLDSALGAK